MMAMTTNSSIKVKPRRPFIDRLLNLNGCCESTNDIKREEPPGENEMRMTTIPATGPNAGSYRARLACFLAIPALIVSLFAFLWAIASGFSTT
jgi:hypothetical protein